MEAKLLPTFASLSTHLWSLKRICESEKNFQNQAQNFKWTRLGSHHLTISMSCIGPRTANGEWPDRPTSNGLSMRFSSLCKFQMPEARAESHTPISLFRTNSKEGELEKSLETWSKFYMRHLREILSASYLKFNKITRNGLGKLLAVGLNIYTCT